MPTLLQKAIAGLICFIILTATVILTGLILVSILFPSLGPIDPSAITIEKFLVSTTFGILITLVVAKEEN